MKQPKQPVNNEYLGLVPPQAIDIENGIIGRVLTNGEQLNEIIDKLKPEVFYKDSNQVIWDAIISLYNSGINIDMLTVVQKLRDIGQLERVGGAYALAQLTNNIPLTVNIVNLALIVLEQYMRRELIRESQEAMQMAYDASNDIFEVLSSAEYKISSISQKSIRKDFQKLASVYKDFTHDLSEKMSMREKGISTEIVSGFPKLDVALGGFHIPDLIIIAGRPSMGKTALGLTFARNIAVQFDRPVGVFSLEMSAKQLVSRLTSMETKVESSRLRDARLDSIDFEKIMNANRLINSKIFIDETPGITITELRAKARRMKAKHGVQIIFIDYIQLMSGVNDKNNQIREQEISYISRSLKTLAKELEMPIVALSQLSRAVETRGGLKKPQLSDLRESGAIEQDADVVIFPYRPEYYKIMEDEYGNSTEGLTELIIAKNRNGELSSPVIYWDKIHTEFVNDNPLDKNPPSVNNVKPLAPSSRFESNKDEEKIPF